MIRLIELNNNFASIQGKEEAIDRAFRSVVVQMTALAVENCPVDTGTLAASIRMTSEDRFVYKIGSSKDYAVYVHDGTSKMPARPFISYAIDQLENEINHAVMTAIRRG